MFLSSDQQYGGVTEQSLRLGYCVQGNLKLCRIVMWWLWRAVNGYTPCNWSKTLSSMVNLFIQIVHKREWRSKKNHMVYIFITQEMETLTIGTKGRNFSGYYFAMLEVWTMLTRAFKLKILSGMEGWYCLCRKPNWKSYGSIVRSLLDPELYKLKNCV